MDINFDISVTYDEKDKAGGEAKITVISLLSGNFSKSNEIANFNVSRVKFTTSMKFSTTKAKTI
jgi:hypothetical protein